MTVVKEALARFKVQTKNGKADLIARRVFAKKAVVPMMAPLVPLIDSNTPVQQELIRQMLQSYPALESIVRDAETYRLVEKETGRKVALWSPDGVDPAKYDFDPDYCWLRHFNSLLEVRGIVGLKQLLAQAIPSQHLETAVQMIMLCRRPCGHPLVEVYYHCDENGNTTDEVCKDYENCERTCNHHCVPEEDHLYTFPVPSPTTKPGWQSLKRDLGPVGVAGLIGQMQELIARTDDPPTYTVDDDGQIKTHYKYKGEKPEVEWIDGSKPLPNDDAEPVFIVTNLAGAYIARDVLELEKRLAANEVTPWYVRNAIGVLTYDQEEDLLKKPSLKVDTLAWWKPVVLVGFKTDALERKLRAAGVNVTGSLAEMPARLAEVRQAIRVVMPVKNPGQHDMPAEVLDGWLGDVCKSRMADFPIAFAWPALLTVASAMVPSCDVRLNLYTALVGPVGSGKSQAIEHACGLLGIKEPVLLNLLAGSAEGLLKKLGDTGGMSRLLSVDELGHLLEKAQIEGASFPYVLDRAYYYTKFEATMSRGREATFNCRLSTIGGVVDDNFGDLFGSNTKGGLHDRFIFGRWPNKFDYKYRPFTGGPALEQVVEDDPDKDFKHTTRPVPVTMDPSVLEMRDKWIADEPDLKVGRVAEHAIRAALVCAAFDGRRVLTAADLGPALAFARYQARVRKMLKPNPGETMEAIFCSKVLGWLDTHAPATINGDHGQWINRRTMYKAISADRFGLGVAERSIR